MGRSGNRDESLKEEGQAIREDIFLLVGVFFFLQDIGEGSGKYAYHRQASLGLVEKRPIKVGGE